MNEQKLIEVISGHGNATSVAITLLVLMLERRGVLEPGAYSKALKDTFNEPDAEFERPDYQMLRRIANLIDKESEKRSP